MILADAFPADWSSITTYFYSVLLMKLDMRSVREGVRFLAPNAHCAIQAGKSQLAILKKLAIVHLSSHQISELDKYEVDKEWRRISRLPSEAHAKKLYIDCTTDQSKEAAALCEDMVTLINEWLLSQRL